ncbi:hypothetical protein DYB32_004814 [Aphanomyces invadans]|uniref:Glutathionylspermidine synthase pre-ATP-grasp-like domain-containing protein n=1 Tax=Aphanomyces invadans TaxID=157072 RepID=A0A418AWD7_9STRA|nr:hypothetical protein DYB32_004814 [Aphanomyces invadans]
MRATSALPRDRICRYLNAVKKDLAVHTWNIARHVGNARYLDATLPFVPTFEAKYGHEVSTSLQTKYYTITETGMKVYEYNADSASCLMECGYTQDAWSNSAGLGSLGRSSSTTLFAQLTAAWKGKNVHGTLHLLCDDDAEERYHSLYMKAAAEAAGISCVLIVGVEELHFDKDGVTILDGQNRPLRNVWKTWAWQTVISQYEARNGLTKQGASVHMTPSPLARTVQVMDVMLHPSVRVFEPLWTVLPSSKAILPILSQLAPDNPYLLRSTFDAADIATFKGGYVAKPVMGRTGANVSIYNSSGDLISATAGKWVDDTIVYQEIALLPKYEDDCYVQVNTWAIDGQYGGTVLRIDESNIIGLNSGIYPVRVVDSHDDTIDHDEVNATLA